ncbi:hypothetical protein HGRIS_004035 [Hohenbuehelia grisea]|uniref:Uncharacterized protein n=1 Tax=Hohenbuehelia grisea TaxID=104357 RepID=A0ABR3JJ03_9AGAR
MSLDQNLFTLIVSPNKDDPSVIDLVDPAGTIHYRKQRIPGQEYNVEVYDFASASLLIKAIAPSSTSKVKTLELCNPTSVVELKYTGTLSFRWSFKWEEHEFEWKREECYMIRKPDPPVMVAVTKEPAGRLKSTSIQILDYNLNRFDINDRKGLEIVMLTALLTFHDSNDSYHGTPKEEGTPTTSLMGSRKVSGNEVSSRPVPPPKPAPKTGVDRVAEIQAARGEYNEIMVEEEGSIDDYGQYCFGLLKDDAMLFITIRSASAEQVPKVLQVVEQTKRIRHKAGMDDELHQYVLYDTVQTPQKGPRRIKLDDDASKGKNKYTPPNSLAVHISKIPMPELQPKATVHGKEVGKNDKEDKKKEKKKEKEDKKKKKDDKKGRSPSPSPTRLPPKANKLTRPSTSPASNSRVHAHQVHPNQPSPSPSQLNNPGIYAAAPPKHPQLSIPQGSQNRPQTSPGPSSMPRPQKPSGHGHSQSFSYQGPQPSLYGPYAPALHPSYPNQGGPITRPPYPPSSNASGSWYGAGVPAPPPPPPPPPGPQQGNASQNPLATATSMVQGFLGALQRR